MCFFYECVELIGGSSFSSFFIPTGMRMIIVVDGDEEEDQE